MSVILTRPIGWTFDVDRHSREAEQAGNIVPLDRRAGWTRGTLVRTETPIFSVPPEKVDFDVTDPLSWYVKGAGYTPY